MARSVALDKGRCAAREARLAQIYCGPKATAIADEGIQLMGGHGYMRENPVERWFRDARTLSLLDGVVGI
jgi:alkylation response protein AidB-like acyl-CoA dehydrogenase